MVKISNSSSQTGVAAGSSAPSSPIPSSSSSSAIKPQPIIVAPKPTPGSSAGPQPSLVQSLKNLATPMLKRAQNLFSHTVTGTIVTGRALWYLATAGVILFIPLQLLLEQENIARLQQFHQRSQQRARSGGNAFDAFLASMPESAPTELTGALDDMLTLPTNPV